MNAIAQQQSGLVESEAEGKSALATLPSEWAKPVAFFAMTKLYLLKSRGPLCANLKYWISKGLTIDDAKRIFQRLCDPEIAQTHLFENQLMADLSGMVFQVLRRRRILRDQELRREEGEGFKAVVSFADSIGMPQDRKEAR